jgi:hypothetical protein
MRSFIYALGEVMAGRPATVDINKIVVYTKEEINPVYWKGLLPHMADGDSLGSVALHAAAALGWPVKNILWRDGDDLASAYPSTPQSLAELYAARPRAQAALANQYPGNVFVKTHLASLMIRGTPTINPSVTRGAVYIVRNPLDVACSFASHMGYSIDEAIDRMATKDCSLEGKNTIPQLIGSWSLNVESWTKERRKEVLVLRYEDMVSDPIGSFTSFVRHAGLRTTDAQIAEAVGATEFGQLRAQEKERGFIVRPKTSADDFFRSGKSGDWRAVLSRRQAKRIVAEHRDQMRRFGYLDEL